MHLIILKWPRRQKCRQKRITVRQKEVEAKEEIVLESSVLRAYSRNLGQRLILARKDNFFKKKGTKHFTTTPPPPSFNNPFSKCFASK